MPYPTFDRARLRIYPLVQRQHDLNLSVLLPLDAPPPSFDHRETVPAVYHAALNAG